MRLDFVVPLVARTRQIVHAKMNYAENDSNGENDCDAQKDSDKPWLRNVNTLQTEGPEVGHKAVGEDEEVLRQEGSVT